MAEALGIREASSWIKAKAWDKVVIESDSLTAVQSIRSSLLMTSYFGSVIEKCRKSLRELSEVSLLCY